MGLRESNLPFPGPWDCSLKGTSPSEGGRKKIKLKDESSGGFHARGQAEPEEVAVGHQHGGTARLRPRGLIVTLPLAWALPEVAGLQFFLCFLFVCFHFKKSSIWFDCKEMQVGRSRQPAGR